MPSKPSGMMSGHLMGLFVAITFGSAYPVGKPLISAVDPVSFSCFRYLVAGALMLLLAHGTGRQISVSRKDLLALTGLGLLGYTLFQGVWAMALDMTTPSKAVILVATAPIFGAFFALIAGQSVGRMIWVGAGVAFLGVYLVVNNGLIPQGMAGGDQFIGDMLFVFIAAVWSLFGLLSRPYVMRLGAWTTTGWAALLGAIILMPFGWEGMTDGGWGRIDWTLGLSFLHLALVVGCLGNAAWSGGLGRLGLPKMVLYLYLSPVVGAGISAVWLGDWLSPVQIAGAALVIGGVALGQSGGISLKRRSPEKRLRTSP